MPNAKKRAPLSEIGHVVEVNTQTQRGCIHGCTGARIGMDHFDDGINHYLESHGYTLLGVGSRIDLDDRGKMVSHTLVLLGAKGNWPKRYADRTLAKHLENLAGAERMVEMIGTRGKK